MRSSFEGTMRTVLPRKKNQRRGFSRVILLLLVATIVAVTITLNWPSNALAYGGMSSPITRTYACYLEGPEHPTSPACQAAVAKGGTRPLYHWNAITIADANGRHRELIPDGKLCSAGQAKYAAYDEPRTDWPSTALQSGAQYTFQYKTTDKAIASHMGTFELYITKNGYDPTQPLKWSDLEDAPFSMATNPPLINGTYAWQGTLPSGKSGRHIIYTIWQRSTSPAAFYGCSDVTFGASSTPAPPPTPSPTSTSCSASAPTPNQCLTPTATANLTPTVAVTQPSYTLTVGNSDPSLNDEVGKLRSIFAYSYPKLMERFGSPTTAKQVILTINPHGTGVAATARAHVTVNATYMKQHPDDLAWFTHELMHVVQGYPGNSVPGWFTEGMADYGRYYYAPPGSNPRWWALPGNPSPTDSYTAGYRVAARFLVWLQQHTSPTIVDQLNRVGQTRQSFSTSFRQITGGTVDQLWGQYRANPGIL